MTSRHSAPSKAPAIFSGVDNPLPRLVGQWIGDRRFQHRSRRPRPLRLNKAGNEFNRLAAIAAPGIKPSLLQQELQRTGMVSVKGETIALMREAYIVSDPQQIIGFYAEDSHDLLVALRENASSAHELPNLHARTIYDNISDDDLAEIREWFLKFGREMHARARRFLSQFDRDISPSRRKGRGKNRVVLTTFSRIESLRSKAKRRKRS